MGTGEKSPYLALKCFKNLSKAHTEAYTKIKSKNADSMVGNANNMTNFKPVNDLKINRALAKTLRYIERDHFISKTIEYQDFIGINHYFKHDVDILGRKTDEMRSDLGWSQSPQSLFSVVEDASKWGKPVLVTEHGIADMKDEKRKKYLRESISELENLEETELLGCLHWSLLDNFEWDKGFWPRFGFIEVDHENNLERKIRESGELYSHRIRESTLGSEE